MGNEILDENIASSSIDAPLLKRLPKDNSILATGIIAIPFSLGIVGIILCSITLSNASKAIETYKANPEAYLESSIKKVRAGRVCAIVSLSLLGTTLLVLIVLFSGN